MEAFRRAACGVLERRLAEPRRFMQVLLGPRQTGKTTIVRQVREALTGPSHYASADETGLQPRAWLEQQWEIARARARAGDAVLFLDEVHKIPGWAESVKALWDQDTGTGAQVKVVLLGSSPFLVQRGLGESLAGRFEVIRVAHWSLSEMRDAFGWDWERYVCFGGFPGPAALVDDPHRWGRYITESLVETTLSRDLLLMTRVDKPALLRRLFDLACSYSGSILSYQKMIGQLQDAGNTTTLAHYLDLLAGAGMVCGLEKFAGQRVRQRGSSPKLQVLNTAFVTARLPRTPAELRADPAAFGHLCESAVGAHLANAATETGLEVWYWRDRNREVDYVLRHRGQVAAVEVKTGRPRTCLPGMAAFEAAFGPTRKLLVGSGGIPIEEFLATPPGQWLEP
ncbi:MAG: ATP-binding protein [Deltaproteobacteria bacterium]|nr:ATP-binding protein [Deltaproteobacteria bacterium]